MQTLAAPVDARIAVTRSLPGQESSDDPVALLDRWVEITGPVGLKLVINALNSGVNGAWPSARISTPPTLANLPGGRRALGRR